MKGLSVSHRFESEQAAEGEESTEGGIGDTPIRIFPSSASVVKSGSVVSVFNLYALWH
jgi:hypothetical protein